MSNRYQFINCGGCAVVSYLIHEKLLGIADNVRTIFYSPMADWLGNPLKPLDQVVAQCEEAAIDMGYLNNNGYHCDHAVTLFDVDGTTYAWDTDQGAMTFEQYTLSTKWRSEHFHIPLAVNRQVAEADIAWNDMFDRNQIKGIKISIKNSKLHKAVV